MATSEWRLTAQELTEWMAGMLAAGKRVIAPVDDGGLLTFRPLKAAGEACLDRRRTRWSPKEFLFPKNEALFSYTVQVNRVTVTSARPPDAEQILVGVHGCDAAGFRRLDGMFLTGEVEPFYAARRARSTIVTLACQEAGPECFCTAVGVSPAGEDGGDLQLMASGDGWLLKALTPKGQALAAGLKAPAPSADERARAEAAVRQVEQTMRQSRVAKEWAALLESNFESPAWAATGRTCIGCSICTFVCPSCSCFDVSDAGNAWCGERCRSWDSCTFGLFTRHASGHNPRATQPARHRQRVLHKFSYYPQRHEGQFMCVGCGRCVVGCPVGINIEQSVHRVVEMAQGGGDARH